MNNQDCLTLAKFANGRFDDAHCQNDKLPFICKGKYDIYKGTYTYMIYDTLVYIYNIHTTLQYIISHEMKLSMHTPKVPSQRFILFLSPITIMKFYRPSIIEGIFYF